MPEPSARQTYVPRSARSAIAACSVRSADCAPRWLFQSPRVFREMQDRFPSIDHWMLGRGLIADPFLPRMIKNDTLEYPENRMEIFSKFHDTLFFEYQQTLSGAKHVIMKMLSFWEYFSLSFPNPKQIIKKVRKAKTFEDYDRATQAIFRLEMSY